MPLTVPGVCRFTIHGRYGGRDIANVLDMQIDTTGTITDRELGISDQAGVLINQWKADIMPRISSNYSFTAVSWVDMATLDGSVGSRTSTGTVTLPANATGATTGATGNVALLVRKNVKAQRGARRGRMYICGVLEGDTQSSNVNLLENTALASWNTAVANFFNNCEQEDIDPFNHQSSFVVVHVTAREENQPDGSPGAPVEGIGLDVTGFSCDQLLATQRRRLRG